MSRPRNTHADQAFGNITLEGDKKPPTLSSPSHFAIRQNSFHLKTVHCWSCRCMRAKIYMNTHMRRQIVRSIYTLEQWYIHINR